MRHLVSLSNLYAHRLESVIPSKTLGSRSCSSCAICTSHGLHFQGYDKRHLVSIKVSIYRAFLRHGDNDKLADLSTKLFIFSRPRPST